MRLNHIAANKNEITLSDGTQVLFSYQTPVAAWKEGEFFKTDKFWSKTTSRHINSWSHCAIEKPQEYFDNLVKGV
jgi:hypothetical protein